MTFIREASSKMYSPYVFALSQLAAETPYSILCSVVFFLLVRFRLFLARSLAPFLTRFVSSLSPALLPYGLQHR